MCMVCFQYKTPLDKGGTPPLAEGPGAFVAEDIGSCHRDLQHIRHGWSKLAYIVVL
jgi:hypothetical protein